VLLKGGVALCLVVLCERGLPLYLYKEQGWCCGYTWRDVPVSTALAWSHATACRRDSREVPMGVGRLLTKPPRHHLHVASCGLVLGHSSGGTSPRWWKLLAILYYSFAQIIVEKRLLVKFSMHFFLYPAKQWQHQNLWNLLDKIIFFLWSSMECWHFRLIWRLKIGVKHRQQVPPHLPLCSSLSKA
jgi:hypothetical protein